MNETNDKKITEHMRKLGKKGGTATSKKYGKRYMSELAKKSWKSRKIVKI